jgi:hypothetical protein
MYGDFQHSRLAVIVSLIFVVLVLGCGSESDPTDANDGESSGDVGFDRSDTSGVETGEPCPTECPGILTGRLSVGPCSECEGGACIYREDRGLCTEWCFDDDNCQPLGEGAYCRTFADSRWRVCLQPSSSR